MYDEYRRTNIADALEDMEPYVVFNEQRIRKTESLLNKLMSMLPSIASIGKQTLDANSTSSSSTETIPKADNGNNRDVCNNV